MKAAFFCDNAATVDRVYGAGRRRQIEELTDCLPFVVGAETFEQHAPELSDVEVVFSTWGMPALSAVQIERMPALRAVFYAAGSVRGFAMPFLEKQIEVVSAWAANAVPVAEFTLAQILLANAGYFRNQSAFREPEQFWAAPRGWGNFGAEVALLGCGQIGRKLIELLRAFELKVLVFDPYLSPANAERLGVELVTLEEAFALGRVVSNHLANVPETVGMLKGRHFDSMCEGATFINTGRGATVNEPELIGVLERRPDLVALLDVTHPEPPEGGSALYRLDNVRLTTHIAGSKGDEVMRMADYVIDEFQAWREGRPLRYAVTLSMLDTMA